MKNTEKVHIFKKKVSDFRYRGKTYFAEDFGDVGSYGDRKFAIFKWNEEKKRYNLLAEM